MTNLLLRLIFVLVQYKTNVSDLGSHIRLIRLDKERQEYLKEVKYRDMDRK